jgi:hypothetical protein
MYCMTWYTGTYGITTMDLLYKLHTMVKYVCVSFRSNGFVTKMQSFPMDGYYKIDIITRCGSPEVRLDHIANVMYGNVQWLGYWHCILVPRDSANPAEKG